MNLEDRFENWYAREQLHSAAAEGDIEKMKRLLAEGHDINSFSMVTWTPLTHAACEEKLEAVKFLLQMGANVNAEDTENIGNTTLKTVAADCTYELAKILIDAGADPTIPGWMHMTALDESFDRKTPEGKKVHALLYEVARTKYPHDKELEKYDPDK